MNNQLLSMQEFLEKKAKFAYEKFKKGENYITIFVIAQNGDKFAIKSVKSFAGDKRYFSLAKNEFVENENIEQVALKTIKEELGLEASFSQEICTKKYKLKMSYLSVTFEVSAVDFYVLCKYHKKLTQSIDKAELSLDEMLKEIALPLEVKNFLLNQSI